MLGRLFKQNSSSSLKDVTSPVQSQTANMNSYEDRYTREILYGVGDKQILRPFELNSKNFRIVVSQDGGSIRSKQVLFDTVNDDKNGPGSTSLAGPKPPKPTYTRQAALSKCYHHPNELNDYMFGGGIPSNENQSITKIHLLPVVNTQNGYKSVLITRLFSISDTEEPEIERSENWNPRPTLPINNAKVSWSNGTNGPGSSKSNLSSRFAIGLVIPIDDDSITDVISNNWHEISHFLIILQKTVCKKMMNLLNNPTESFIISKRIQFPSYILNNDIDLHNNLLKLVKLINYDGNIPKLINSNALMRLSLGSHGVENTKYNPMVLNWVLEVLNWLEFKELNESSKFLASLLALIIPYRFSLTERPYHYNYESKTKEITRIVVMTGNPMVSKKLIFILNGLIPDYELFHLLSEREKRDTRDEEAVEDSSDSVHSTIHRESTHSTLQRDAKSDQVSEKNEPMTSAQDTMTSIQEPATARQEPMSPSTQDGFPNTKSPVSQSSNISPPPTTLNQIYNDIDTDIDTDVDEIDEENLSSFSSPSPPLANSNPIPIKIKSKPSQSFSSSENSFSQVSTKGWEIPGKATPLTSTSVSNSIPNSVSNSVNSNNIPINKMRRQSLTKSSSMAYLSSSLNSSMSSSASNYSLSKLGGSFIEKWRNSFNNSVNYDNIDYHPNGYPGPGGPGGFGAIGAGGPGHGSGTTSMGSSFGGMNHNHNHPNRHVSFNALKTPSPALEVEGFNLSLNSSSNATPSPVLTTTSSCNGKQLSKTQSMFDLYNSSVEKTNMKAKSLGDIINRTKASVYADKHFTNNEEIIKNKVGNIMDGDFSFLETEDDDNTLEIQDQTGLEELTEYEDLSPNVAFTDEFRPEFILQSCPMNPKLEQQIISAMKNDLLFHQNNCKVENITTRTIFISLRAREVKLIEMKYGDTKIPSQVTTPQPLSGSPLNSYFSHLQPQVSNGFSPSISDTPQAPTSFFRRSNNSYKTTIKKVYSPIKNNGDLELVNSIDHNLNEIRQLFLSNYKELNNDTPTNNDFNEKLSTIVSSLLD